jgi:[CysO sulfur-carrier protein]-S-L-cysteine hydrolase
VDDSRINPVQIVLYARLTMRIASELYDEIVAHARAEAPNECCGMIAARDGQAVRVYRTTNAAASPLRFEIHPDEQIRVHTEIEAAQLDLGAIYHSHTRTAPNPSQTDINFAAWWPGVLWIIVGFDNGQTDVRTWRIAEGEVSEAELLVG